MTADTTARKMADVMWLAAACALTSAVYFLLRAVGYLTVGGGFATVSRDVAWMSPLAHLLLFGACALPFLVLALFLPRSALLKWSLAAFLAVALFSALMPWGQLSAIARLILSVAVAFELARRWSKSDRLVLIGRRLAISLAALCTVASLAIAATRSIGRQRTIAALPSAPAGAPNVLFIILDTVRASALSLYGYERRTTPQLEAFAAKGTVFETAIATAPWTLPSHASLFTGRYPAWLNIDFRRRLGSRETTLAEVLSRRGYYTLGIIANTSFVSWESGLARGFTEFHDYPISFEQIARSTLPGNSTIAERVYTGRDQTEKRTGLARQFEVPPKPQHYLMPATELTDIFLKWRAKRDTSRPYFAFLNYFDAHFPYSPPDSFGKLFAAEPNERDLYDAEIAYMDAELGRLFGELERSGELRNTIVVVASDHGEHFGERGLRLHGNSLYTATVGVPLVVRYDGHVPSGKRVTRAVSLRDVGKTILDLTGAAPNNTFPGASLARAWNDSGDSISAPVALLMRGPEPNPLAARNASTMLAVLDDRWHLVQMAGKRQVEELFDYHADKDEEYNVIGVDSAREAVPRLREQLRVSILADRPAGRGRARAKGK